MMHLKILGLAAATTLALVAFLGAGSASATVLCKRWESPCKTANLHKASTTVSTKLKVGASSIFKTTGGTTLSSCAASLMATITKNDGGNGERVEGENSSLLLEECSATTTLTKSGEFSIEYVPVEPINTRANLWISEFELSITTAGTTCAYGGEGETFLGTLTAGTPAPLHVKTTLWEAVPKLICPDDVIWEGNYEVTAPNPSEESLYFKEEAI